MVFQITIKARGIPPAGGTANFWGGIFSAGSIGQYMIVVIRSFCDAKTTFCK